MIETEGDCVGFHYEQCVHKLRKVSVNLQCLFIWPFTVKSSPYFDLINMLEIIIFNENVSDSNSNRLLVFFK